MSAKEAFDRYLFFFVFFVSLVVLAVIAAMPHLVVMVEAANRQLVPIVFALLHHAGLAILGRARAADTHGHWPDWIVIRRHTTVAVLCKTGVDYIWATSWSY